MSITEKLFIKPKHERRIHSGHLWVFSNELQSIDKLPAGSVVEVLSTKNKTYGYGFYNPNSLISVRLLNWFELPDLEFFKKRISNALELRKLLFPDENSFRLVFGESDFLPGLIIDKYEDYFSMQILSVGMENLKSLIITALLEVFPQTKGIIQKNNSHHRELESLSSEDEILFGQIPESIIISENGVKISVSLEKGQKTGYFFDQRENRLAIRKFSKDRKVLDCFSNLSGFALNSSIASAAEVTSVDSSESAITNSKINAKLNDIKNIEFHTKDVFDFFKSAIAADRKWDLIILDPPAFTKNKKNIDSAVFGYGKLNALGIQCLNENGILATASCSQHISEDLFFDIIVKEAAKLNKQLRLLYRGMQSPDHPVLASMPETKYLKFFVFQVE